MTKRSSRRAQDWEEGWRETLISLKEFCLPILIFLVAMIGLGILYHHFARQAGEPMGSLLESVYLMLSLAYLRVSPSPEQAGRMVKTVEDEYHLKIVLVRTTTSPRCTPPIQSSCMPAIPWLCRVDRMP